MAHKTGARGIALVRSGGCLTVTENGFFRAQTDGLELRWIVWLFAFGLI